MQDLKTVSHLISISRLWTVGSTAVSVLRVRGAVTSHTHDDFAARLADATERSRWVLLNLSEVGAPDAASLEVIQRTAASLQSHGGWLRLVHADPAVLGPVGSLPVAPTEEAAVGDLASEAA